MSPSNIGGISAMVLNNNLADIDEKQMKQALKANLQEKQEQIDKMQLYIQKLNFELQSKVERCEYLRGIYDNKSKEALETEQTLKREIQEITERLEIINLFTKREKFSHKQLKEKNSYKLDQQEAKLAKLEQEKNELVESNQSIELQVRQQQEEKEVKLRAALRPLEEAKKEIMQQYQLYSSRKRVCDQHKERFESLLSSEKHEEEQNLQVTDALIEDINKLQKEIEEMRISHADEYEIFQKEYEEEKQLKQIIEEKSKLEGKMQKLEKFCKKLREDIDKLESDQLDSKNKAMSKVNKQLTDLMNMKMHQNTTNLNQILKRNHEILKVENFFSEKESEFKSLSIFRIISDEAQLESIIKKYQSIHINKEIEQLTNSFNLEEKQREEEIQSLLKEIQNSKGLEKSSIKWINQKYQQAIDKQKEQRFLYKRKQDLLNTQLKEFNSLKIQQKNYSFDQIKQQYLTKIWARMNCDQEERQNYQNILDLYLERVSQRENQLSTALKERAQLEEDLYQLTQILTEKKLQLSSNQDQVDQLQVKIKELQKKEKILTKSLEDRYTQVEFQLFKFGEKNFEEYYTKHEVLFEGVKKTYGKKVCDKMKIQQKREFIEITVQQYKRRISELKKRQFKIEENKEKIEDQNKKLRDIIYKEIEKTQDDLEVQNLELKTVEMQLQATQDALSEINKEIDSLTQSRQLEIRKWVHTLYKQKNYEGQRVRIQTLNEEITKITKFINRIKGELEVKDNSVFEKTTNYKAEEAQLKVRSENFKKAFQDIQRAIKPQLIQMEREVKELVFQINTGRKKLESLFDKYTVLLQQQSLINKTLTERFGHDEFQNISIQHHDFKQFTVEDCDQEEHYEESEAIPKVSSAAFHFDEEYKKLQNIIEADERIKLQPINNQIIQEISEEYDEERSSQLPNTSHNNTNFSSTSAVIVNSQSKKVSKDKKQTVSQKKRQDQEKIDQNMQELMDNINTSEFNNSQRNEIKISDNAMEISTIGNEKYLIDFSGSSNYEIEFFTKIKMLFEGEEIYKKFGSSSISQKAFDPLEVNITPESKGFGKRVLRISSDLSKIDLYKAQSNSILQNQSNNLGDSQNQSSQTSSNYHLTNGKLQSEGGIQIEKLMKIVIPNVTQDIIKYQKQGSIQKNIMNYDGQISSKNFNPNQKQLTGVKREQEEYKEKCLQAKSYPFSLVLSDKTLDFVCMDYNQFKYVTEALEELLKRKNQGQISKLAKRINVY